MQTPSCKYCDKQWSYAETFKNIFKPRMICSHCGEENYYQSDSKNSWITLFGIPIVLIVALLLDLSTSLIIFISVILVLVHIVLFPYRTKLKKKDKN
ncbi:TIGR04104 family putative zinc finger protein [Oceanobacillus sp. 1P07AA]|uniref:TIGR04104 family putative zinc finger protein n=1 Tax=Oceanobacillus sp. 1P07AA TaxID=3132293 RepID=UPI0039A7473A